MLTPTIHMNGTPASELRRVAEVAYGKTGELRLALAHIAPNGRDYYPQGERAVYEAEASLRAMLAKVAEIRQELEEYILSIPI